MFLTAGCDQNSAAQPPKSASGASAATTSETVERVTVGKPERKSIARSTTQPGRIEAFEETPLHAKLEGYVDTVLVDIGDRVEKGQVLVRLSVPEMKDELAQKEALVAQAQAEIVQAQAAIRASEAAAETAQARVREAQAGIARAEADYKRWESENARVRDLVSGGTVTRKLADETLNQFRAADASRHEAQARVDSAEAAANQSRSNIESAKADLAAARARMRVAEANLKKAQTLLDYSEIRAPYSGIITRRFVDTGHYVQPAAAGSQPLMVVCHADVVRVFVDVPEMETPLVNTGDAATIQLQSLGAFEVRGEVTRTSWDLDPANRSLRVEIDVPNEQGRLRPGMYATASVLLEERDDVLVLPVAAIVRQGGEAHCCQVINNRIQHTPVKLGLRSGNEIEIVSGLKGTEVVVMLRADTLKAGQPVEILPAEPPK
jgi:RND family efflux transporter MFP subunit